MTSARRFIGGLESEIGRIVHTPQDIEDRFAAPKGAYVHVDIGPLRLGVNRPAHGLGGYKPPVAGQYLAGAGSHPGGTVNGWCGRLAARAAMGDEPTTPAARPPPAGGGRCRLGPSPRQLLTSGTTIIVPAAVFDTRLGRVSHHDLDEDEGAARLRDGRLDAQRRVRRALVAHVARAAVFTTAPSPACRIAMAPITWSIIAATSPPLTEPFGFLGRVDSGSSKAP